VKGERRDSAGNVTGRFEINALKVVLATRDASLFDVPENYREMPPLRLDEALAGSAAETVSSPPSVMERLEREDQEYFTNHRNAGLR
jgi:hypothetical protein